MGGGAWRERGRQRQGQFSQHFKKKPVETLEFNTHPLHNRQRRGKPTMRETMALKQGFSASAQLTFGARSFFSKSMACTMGLGQHLASTQERQQPLPTSLSSPGREPLLYCTWDIYSKIAKQMFIGPTYFKNHMGMEFPGWLMFDPWPENFCVQWAQPKKKKIIWEKWQNLQQELDPHILHNLQNVSPLHPKLKQLFFGWDGLMDSESNTRSRRCWGNLSRIPRASGFCRMKAGCWLSSPH